MKKNKFIENKLNAFADGLHLNPDVITDAGYEVMRLKSNVEETRRPRKKAWIAAVACCASIVLSVVAALLLRQPQTQTITPYSLSSLTSKSVETVENTSAAPFTFDNARILQKEYKATDGETRVVAANIISVTDHGTDSIVVYQDFGKGLSNYKTYKGYPEREINGVKVRVKTDYKKGEYYSYCFFEGEDCDYYITIMSPSDGALEYYFGKN